MTPTDPEQTPADPDDGAAAGPDDGAAADPDDGAGPPPSAASGSGAQSADSAPAGRTTSGESAGRRLIRSLSARSRGEGWEPPAGDLAKYRSRWRSAVRFVLQRILFRGLVRANVTPRAEVDRRVRTVRGPFVLVANHSSHVDAPMLAQGLPWAQARFLSTGVAADYFFDVWYRRWFVRWIFNAFPIDRGGSRKHSGMSRRLLRSGVPILVFPEGGRQETGRMAEFKPGGAALAIGVGVPVVPAAIVGAHEAMPKGRSWPKPGRPPVTVAFGRPVIAFEGESAVDFTARIRERVVALYEQHYEEILGQNPGEEDTG